MAILGKIKESLFAMLSNNRRRKTPQDHDLGNHIKAAPVETGIRTVRWEEIQEYSDNILFEGLRLLTSQPYMGFDSSFPLSPGNYLISYERSPMYIGESTNLSNRIKEHSQYDTSTFYRNYLAFQKKHSMLECKEINDFVVQVISTNLGRKELEEFGMVNLQTPLNKFHKNKRRMVTDTEIKDLWNYIQSNSLQLLSQAGDFVFSGKPILWGDIPPYDRPGIYIVWDQNGELIYIGETTSLLERYQTHSSKTRFSALRRHIAQTILGYKLRTKSELGIESKDKKRGFITEDEDTQVSNYLANCKAIFYEVRFGRLELEEHLIRKYQPLLNRKGNKNRNN